MDELVAIRINEIYPDGEETRWRTGGSRDMTPAEVGEGRGPDVFSTTSAQSACLKNSIKNRHSVNPITEKRSDFQLGCRQRNPSNIESDHANDHHSNCLRRVGPLRRSQWQHCRHRGSDREPVHIVDLRS
jgi:hypothetical protein